MSYLSARDTPYDHIVATAELPDGMFILSSYEDEYYTVYKGVFQEKRAFNCYIERRRLYINGVVTQPEFQKKGFCFFSLRQIIKVHAIDGKHVYWDSYVQNGAANSVYLKIAECLKPKYYGNSLSWRSYSAKLICDLENILENRKHHGLYHSI